ncbi:MAG: carboxypeptidase regulatory-like domain-containing protein [Planctomycetes bacterium]|nr:carboxypeptidase regulatory-like domain-containing protein [Planctomycetota bacterium]
MRRFCAPVLFAFAAGAIGCSGDGLRRVPVEGTVTAKGVPVANASVSFLPTAGTKGEGGIGTTDAQGKFTLTGSRQGDSGVVAGKYKVRLSRYVDKDGTQLPPDAKQADYPSAIESVPPPYSAPDSPLEVTVPEGGGAIKVELPVPLRSAPK